MIKDKIHTDTQRGIELKRQKEILRWQKFLHFLIFMLWVLFIILAFIMDDWSVFLVIVLIGGSVLFATITFQGFRYCRDDLTFSNITHDGIVLFGELVSWGNIVKLRQKTRYHTTLTIYFYKDHQIRQATIANGCQEAYWIVFYATKYNPNFDRDIFVPSFYPPDNIPPSTQGSPQ